MGPKFDLRERLCRPAFFGVASVVVSIALAAVGVGEVWSSRSTLVALDRIDVTNAEANELERLVIDTDTALRGFVVTGDRTFLEPRTAALAVLDTRFDELEAHLATDPAQLARLRSIRGESVHYRELGDRILALRESGGDAAGLIATRATKRSTDQMRATFQEIVLALGAEHERRSAGFQASRWQPLALLGGLLLVGSLAQALLAQTFSSLKSRAVLALERDRHAAQLETQKRWLESVIDQSPAGIAIAESPTGRILYRSAAMFGWLGTRPTTGAIADYASLRAERPDGRPYEAHDYPIARALRGEDVVEELVWRRPDGSSTSAQTAASPVRDVSGAIIGAIAIGQDLTERKRFEQTLRESERREREARQQAEHSSALLDSFLARSPLGACIIDVEGRHLLANDALAASVGLRAADLVGRTVRDVIAEPSLLAQVEGLIRRVVESGEPVVDHELEIRSNPESTEVTHWLVTYYPIKSSAGTVTEIGVIVHDVTARKRAERALAEAEGRAKTSRLAAERSSELLDSFLARSPLGACVLDVEGRYLHANDALAAIVGLRAPDLVGRTVREVIAEPSLRAPVEDLIRRVVESGEPVVDLEFESKKTPESTEARNWLVTYYPIKSSAGTVTAIGAIVHDVTARKRAERALAEAEGRAQTSRLAAERSTALFDAFMSASPIAACALDSELRYVFANASYASSVGSTLEELPGRSVRDILPQELIERVEPHLRQVLESRTPVSGLEVRGKRKPDSEEQSFQVAYFPIGTASGPTLGVGALVQNVTDRKKAEEALRESEQRERAARETAERTAALLDAFLSVSPIGTSVLDLDLRIVRVNEALAAILGRPKESVVGFHPWQLMPDELASRVEPLLRRARAGETVSGIEIRGRAKPNDPEDQHFIVSYVPIKSATGELLGVGSLVRDVTDRKRAEARLEELLAKEKEARREAERATGLRDEFLAVVSHDLRTPLASILISASLLLSKRRGPVDVAPIADRIRASARRMDRMIQDLLDVARVEAGRIVVELAPISAAEILREAYDAHAPLAEEAALQLNAEVPDVPLEAWCDRERVLQVLANLIGNAIKFTPAGGTVALASSATDDELVFAVSDSGPGIAEDQLPHVFERFWQAQRGRAGGLGLGLYIAKALVELQGGRIWVESGASRDTAGATFRFTLPRARGARTGVRAAERP